MTLAKNKAVAQEIHRARTRVFAMFAELEQAVQEYEGQTLFDEIARISVKYDQPV